MNRFQRWARNLEPEVIIDYLAELKRRPLSEEFAKSKIGSRQANECDHDNPLVVAYWESFRRKLNLLCAVAIGRSKMKKLAERQIVRETQHGKNKECPGRDIVHGRTDDRRQDSSDCS